MNREKYLKDRQDLLAKAEGLINEGKTEEAEKVMEDIRNLDAAFDATCKAQANLNAMRDSGVVVPLENKSVAIEGGVPATAMNTETKTEDQIYVDAWSKYMMGRKLEKNEQEVFDKINNQFRNAYTHDTTNTTVLIPETVAAGIWKRAAEGYPLYADAKKFAVPGKFSIKKHTAIDAGDADWYAEGTDTSDEQNTFGELVLSGCELSKSITVSWKLKAMAITEFIPYIIDELGERCGAALGKSASSGAGPTANPPEPLGVETALLAEEGTPQVVTYDPDHATTPVKLTYAKVTEAIGKIHSSYLDGCAIYAKNSTIWEELATLTDDNGRPLFIPDVTSGGVGKMFGMTVKADAGVTGKNIIIGNAQKGLVYNVNEPMSVATEDHVKARETDYAAYSIVDGGVLDTKAFALIQDTPAA